MKRYGFAVSGHAQRGAVLFISLIFLVIIALLAVVAANNSVLEEKMVGGMRNAQLAQMGADSVVRGVESLIWNRVDGTAGNTKINCGYNGGGANDKCYARRTDPSSTTTTVSQLNSVIYQFRAARTWLASASDGGLNYSVDMTGLTGANATAKLAQRQRYLIEEVGKVLPPGSIQVGMGGRRLSLSGRDASSQTMYAYRITGRSAGGSTASVRASESLFIALPPSN